MSDYHVLYPSGQRFALSGDFAVVEMAGTVGAVPLVQVGAKAFMLDPRAVVLLAGRVIYDPRGRDDVAGWVHEWLVEHPEWPAVAELSR